MAVTDMSINALGGCQIGMTKDFLGGQRVHPSLIQRGCKQMPELVCRDRRTVQLGRWGFTNTLPTIGAGIFFIPQSLCFEVSFNKPYTSSIL